ncbi:MAG TPA: DUF362 domain-containing protein, partial [Thermoleophilia bacterium]|nr:DUF362 domain-containing protein [Thermoleophilia bacterium]
EVFALLGGVENLVKPRSTVVLKPNAGHPAAAETSVNTSPEFVAAVVKEVKKANPKDVIVAEAAAIGCDSMHVLDVSGIGAAAEAAGARLIDIKRETDLINIPIRDAHSDLKKVKLPRFLLEAEHLFNLPIFKSHASMVFTCALKNMKGVVQDITHQQMHMTDLAAAMMDVWSVIRADLSIADLIRPAEGFGPHTTIPVEFGCVVGSKDPVALDATACRMVGLATDKVMYFKAAGDRNLGNFNEEDIEVVGRTIAEVHKDLWFPYLEGFETWPEYNFYTSNACSSCESLVAFTMEKLKALGQYDKNAGCHVVVGSKKDEEMPQGVDPDNVILIGDCVKRFARKGIGHWSAGCPPLEPHPLWVFIDREDHFEMEPYFRARMAEDEGPWIEYISKMRREKSGGKSDK